MPAQYGSTVPSGIAAPGGRWVSRCPAAGPAALAFVDLDQTAPDDDVRIAVELARPWRRRAKDGLYAAYWVDGDPRSQDVTAF